jgi:nuclear cap-binding protein subunit 1
MALITELCKLSPQTVGPAVGKSIRKIYSYCANGLDVEVLRRFAEWFSAHMSNFGFQWVWKEWFVPSFPPIVKGV